MDFSNISNLITQTLNSLFNNLFSSMDNSIYEILDKITFLNSSLISDDNFRYIYGSTPNMGILLIVNSFILGFLLYFILSHYIETITMKNSQNTFSFLFKLVICGICVNCSYFIISYVLDVFSYITDSILQIGYSIFGKKMTFSNLFLNIENNLSKTTIEVFSIEGIIQTTLSFSLLGLVLSNSFRYILLKLLILLFPFSILCLSTDKTSIFFKTWLKNFLGLMFIQVLTSIVLTLMFSLKFNTMLSKFIYIGGIYTLLKANSISSSFFGNISTTINSNSIIRK